MRHNKNAFRHESLQDARSISELLQAVQKGLAKGELEFVDEDGSIKLAPRGLLQLKVTASEEDEASRVNIRITWQAKGKKARRKGLKVRS